MEPDDPNLPPPPPPPLPPPGWEDEGADEVPAGGPSWEFRAELGWFKAAARTTGEALFNPGETFARAKRAGDYRGPMLYAFIFGTVFLMISEQFAFIQVQATRSLLESLPQTAYQAEIEKMIDDITAAAPLGRNLARIPIQALVAPFLASAALHLFLFVFGAANHGFEATYRACAYTFGATSVLMAIPVCGPPIAALWWLVVLVIALARIHESEAGRVLLAALFALFFSCCCLFGFEFVRAMFQVPAAAL